jgi:ribosomal protein S18 acetylase RimI-like enzyme
VSLRALLNRYIVPNVSESSLSATLQGASLIVPKNEADLERYFELRWRVLRAPWDQPRGSERDDREDESIHLMVRDANGGALAVGRLHLNSPTEAQVRFMAVDPRAQGRGLGSLILRSLEERAQEAGARTVVLNARESAQRFYEQHAYRVEGPAPRLFGGVDHLRMRKDFVKSPADPGATLRS